MKVEDVAVTSLVVMFDVIVIVAIVIGIFALLSWL